LKRTTDIVMRRTTLAIEGRLTAAGLKKVASVAAGALGWDEARQASGVAAVKEQLTGLNLVSL
jgi:glycerol-3-phosphate dehydrogenase